MIQDVRGRSPTFLERNSQDNSQTASPTVYAGWPKEARHAQSARGKRVQDAANGSFVVVGRASNGQPDPYFDKSRGVWVAPWHKPDGKVGRPTGRTRAAAEASRARHVTAAVEAAPFVPLAEGFHAGITVAELSRWWMDNVARHHVRATTWATYAKRLKFAGTHLGDVPVRTLRPEQVAAIVSRAIDDGSAARARNGASAPQRSRRNG